MFSIKSKTRGNLISPFVATLIGIMLLIQLVSSYPSIRIPRFARSLSSVDNESAEQSFQKFINQVPDSTVIGELRPDMSELQQAIMREKISEAIKSIQERDKHHHSQKIVQIVDPECYIEVSKTQKIPGKCRKVGEGVPICQSDSYVSIDSSCNSQTG